MQTPAFLMAPRDVEATSVDRWAGVSGAESGGFVPQIAPALLETPPKPLEVDPVDLGLRLLAEARPAHNRLVVRCTPEFHAWAAGLADFWGVSLTSLVEQSLRRAAESSGFDQLPPRRYLPSPRFRPASVRALVNEKRETLRGVSGGKLDEFGSSAEPNESDGAITSDAPHGTAPLGL